MESSRNGGKRIGVNEGELARKDTGGKRRLMLTGRESRIQGNAESTSLIYLARLQALPLTKATECP